MTAIPTTTHNSGAQSDLHIWNCASCRCVHLRAADMLLTFTREEYTAFAHAVAECYFGGACAEALPNEFAQLPNITELVN